MLYKFYVLIMDVYVHDLKIVLWVKDLKCCVLFSVRGLLFKYALKGLAECKNSFNPDCLAEGLQDEARFILEYLEAVETVRHSQSEEEVARLISQHSLLQEHVPMWMKHSKLVLT